MKIGTTRVETFSDGVIAIIITIMVLSLKLPDINHPDSAWTVRHQLYRLIPYFVTYVFSFLMIGIFWVNHHHMFHMLDKTDERLLLLNLLFMFWMSLIPLSTAMMGANPRVPDSVALYGFIMLMTTMSFAIMRTYTLKKNLVHKDENQEIASKIRWVSLKARTKTYIGTAAYLCAVPLAYVNVYIAYFFFLVAPVIFFIPDGIDDERLAEKIEEKNND
ncbi:MAG TPA: TMEM175 family protein [Flavisolibacter sp.]|nr:TMEM175 family protein [Flavisolibacter sp.]